MYEEMYGEETTPGYGMIAWSQNPSGYPSGYSQGYTRDTERSFHGYDEQKENERQQKQDNLESRSQEVYMEKTSSGKRDKTEIYDNQEHPFCFGAGMSSSF